MSFSLNVTYLNTKTFVKIIYLFWSLDNVTFKHQIIYDKRTAVYLKKTQLLSLLLVLLGRLSK